MDEFSLPAEPGLLWAPDSEHPGLRCEQWVDLSETDPAELADLAESEGPGGSCLSRLNGDSCGARPGLPAPPEGAGGRAKRSSSRPPRRCWCRRSPPPLAACSRRAACPGPAPARPPPADLAFVLCDQDPLCIVEQANFDQLCSLAAVFGRVAGPKRRQLIDSLCSSLTCLNAWIDKLLATPVDQQDPEAVRQHRSAFKAYNFFLAWISGQAGREARDAAAAAPAPSGASQAPSGRGGGRKKKAAADGEGLLAGWDWATQFPKVVKAVAQAMNTDLWALHRPSAPEEAMLIKATQLVSRSAPAVPSPGICCRQRHQAVLHAMLPVPPGRRRAAPPHAPQRCIQLPCACAIPPALCCPVRRLLAPWRTPAR